MFAMVSMVTFAQKDVEVIMFSPTGTTTYNVGDTILMRGGVINTGTVDLDTNTVFNYGLDMGPYFFNIGPNNSRYRNIRFANTLTVGDTFALPPHFVIADQNIADSVSIHWQICKDVILFERVLPEDTLALITEIDMNNNKACSKLYNVEVSEVYYAQVDVYPNPVQDVLNINITNDAAVLEISDMSGRVVKTTNVVNGVNQVDVSELASGNYVFTLNANYRIMARGKFSK